MGKDVDRQRDIKSGTMGEKRNSSRERKKSKSRERAVKKSGN